jgi:hypothetical protein
MDRLQIENFIGTNPIILLQKDIVFAAHVNINIKWVLGIISPYLDFRSTGFQIPYKRRINNFAYNNHSGK